MIQVKPGAFFFDSETIVRSVAKATRAVLSKFGAFVRQTAKNSIRTRPGPSPAGMPPHSHKGTLRRLIYFGYDANTRSVVVGPVPFAGASGTAPSALEYGGTARLTTKSRRHLKSLRRHRFVGGAGEIRLDGTGGKSTKENRFGRVVTYAKLRTMAQAARANRLNAELYEGRQNETETAHESTLRSGSARIEARPYMRPAMQKELPKLPAMWAGSIK
jgi:hypothetical protein